jgi:tetratricopeptide (TPR) repeat protein
LQGCGSTKSLNLDPNRIRIHNPAITGIKLSLGALYANNGGLEKAVADFEAALLINPQHQNAKKYLCETLIAVARNYEDDSKVTEKS